MAFWDWFDDSKPRSDAYDEGREAYKNELSFWANPHCAPTSQVVKANAWWAGWTYEKQLEQLNKACE